MPEEIWMHQGSDIQKVIRIILADDHRLMTECLRVFLEKDSKLKIIGEATDGYQAVALVQQLEPDLVLMDASMPHLNGIEATRQLRVSHPHVAVVCLSMHAESYYVTAMLKAGAAGYLLKDCIGEELLRAVRVVMSGQVYLSPTISISVVEELRSLKPSSAIRPKEVLTSRERQVLQLLAEGYSAKEISGRLHLSVKTVATHREHIMAKVGTTSIAGLTRYAIKAGFSGLDVSFVR